jgi:hypothetical protein
MLDAAGQKTLHRRSGWASRREADERNGKLRQRAAQRTQHAEVLEVVVLDELHDDVLVRLDLQHLQDEADELGGLLRLAVHAADLQGRGPGEGEVCRRGAQPNKQ